MYHKIDRGDFKSYTVILHLNNLMDISITYSGTKSVFVLLNVGLMTIINEVLEGLILTKTTEIYVVTN